MKKLTFLIISILSIMLAQNKPNTIALRPIQTDTDSVFVINSSKDLYYIKVKTNTGGVLGGVVLAMNQSTGDLSLTIGGAAYTANLGTQNDFESATYSSATGEITLTANNGTNTVLTIDGSETKLTGGAGINLTGNGTSATPYNVEALDVSPTNELQTLGLSGNVLSISGANSVTLPNTSPVLVASNDLIISGGNLMTGAPLTQNTETVQNGFSRSFTGGNFGLGTPFPNNVLEINSGTLDSAGLRFTQVNKYTPKSVGETSYLAVNSLGNVVVGDTIKGCPDTIVNYNSHKFIGVRGGVSNILGWDFSTFQIIPNAENLYVTFADNNGLQDALIGAGTIQDFLVKIIDFYTNSFQPATGNTSTLTYVENGSFGYIQVTGLNNNLQMQIRNDGTGAWGYGNNPNPDNDGLEGFAPLSIGGELSDCEIIDIRQDSFDYATDKVFFVRESSEQAQILNGTYLGWSYPLGIQWDNPFVSPYSAITVQLNIDTDGLGYQVLTVPTPKTYNSLSEYEADINALAASYGSSFRVKFNSSNDYAFLTDLAGNPLLNSDPYISNNSFSYFELVLENSFGGFVFKRFNPKDVTVSNFNFITAVAQDSMYYGSLPGLSQSAARLNYRAYASPDSALFWNGDSLYLDDFSAVAAQFSKSTWNASATLQPSNDINDRAYRFGDVSIGFPSVTPSNTLHIQSTTVPNTGGVRLPITSASPTFTGQPIGVNANGDIVRIAPSASGITSLGGQTGLTQTLSVTNTTAAQGWTSIANNHSLNLRAWDLNGNAGTNQALNFVGTTDAVDLAFRTNNTERMRVYQNGGVGIGTTTPAAKVLGSELSVQTGGFTRVSATHTATGTTGRSEFFAGTNTSSRFSAFGYTNAGFAAPFTGVSAAYGYIALSAATDFFIGQNGQAQPMWEFKATSGNTGIGTNNPQVKLDVNGGLATEVRTVTVSGALIVTDHVTLINNGATAFTVTLPAAASFTGRHIIVKRIDNTSTGTITINTAGGQVQALAGTLGATTSLAAVGTYGQAAHFISNGTNWYRIN